MTFEEFLVVFTELKIINIEKGETITLEDAQKWAVDSWYGSMERAREAYKECIDNRFGSGCPLKINRILFSEETEQDIGCINNSEIWCSECWKRIFEWYYDRRCGFWRLNDEI